MLENAVSSPGQFRRTVIITPSIKSHRSVSRLSQVLTFCPDRNPVGFQVRVRTPAPSSTDAGAEDQGAKAPKGWEAGPTVFSCSAPSVSPVASV